MTTSLIGIVAFIVLLAVAHTLLVRPSGRPGPAERAFAEDPAFAVLHGPRV
jgi:hypothetical protein